MNSNDFVQRYLGLFPHENFNERSLQLLGGIVDTSKDGLVGFFTFSTTT